MTAPVPPQHPPYYPPPPKKRRVWPWVLGGFAACILLLFGGCAALIGGVAHEASKQEAERTTAAPRGSEVRDGKFAFVVTSLAPPVSEVGDNPYLRKQAQGEYVLVHVDVTNTGDRPQTYFGDNQKLVDDQGRLYSNDTGAEINLNKDLSTEINPGNKISVTIAFDVPKGTQAAAIEFHDSAFSGGARVAVK
ncbi:DUF4352 domain-containing protein [Nocardia nova]|uniref:DUF4352 domain-containing protein n=1 Tax=Nocardia nova TaxID=37330 RepID=UPI001C45AD66|nr:DUF4352 domain-containing protein [Nocardia nova]MBV7705308.1 DUF4352 domain-containing protein [Nocardia nova]